MKKPLLFVHGRRQMRRDRDALHPGQRAQPVRRTVVEEHARGVARVTCTRQLNGEREQARRESKPTGAVVICPEAAREQAGGGEQAHAERDLSGDEHAARTPRLPAFARAARFVAQRSLRISASDRERRPDAEREPGEQASSERHDHRAGVERQIRVARQRVAARAAQQLETDRREQQAGGAAERREQHSSP